MKKVLVLVAALAIAYIPFARAEGPAGQPAEGQEIGSGPDMMDKGFSKAIDGLKLTEEQQQKLGEIRDSSKREILVLKHEIQLAVLDIQDEYKKDKSDAAKINSFIDKLADAQKKMMKLRSEQMLKMKAVLTPVQFKNLLEKMDKAKTKVKKSFFDRLRGK
jgi:Spy/CpxP family protein refolding chaperone